MKSKDNEAQKYKSFNITGDGNCGPGTVAAYFHGKAIPDEQKGYEIGQNLREQFAKWLAVNLTNEKEQKKILIADLQAKLQKSIQSSSALKEINKINSQIDTVSLTIKTLELKVKRAEFLKTSPLDYEKENEQNFIEKYNQDLQFKAEVRFQYVRNNPKNKNPTEKQLTRYWLNNDKEYQSQSASLLFEDEDYASLAKFLGNGILFFSEKDGRVIYFPTKGEADTILPQYSDDSEIERTLKAINQDSKDGKPPIVIKHEGNHYQTFFNTKTQNFLSLKDINECFKGFCQYYSFVGRKDSAQDMHEQLLLTLKMSLLQNAITQNDYQQKLRDLHQEKQILDDPKQLDKLEKKASMQLHDEPMSQRDAEYAFINSPLKDLKLPGSWAPVNPLQSVQIDTSSLQNIDIERFEQEWEEKQKKIEEVKQDIKQSCKDFFQTFMKITSLKISALPGVLKGWCLLKIQKTPLRWDDLVDDDFKDIEYFINNALRDEKMPYVVEFDKNGNITCRDLTLAMHAFKVITEQARTYIIGDPNAENSYTTEEKEQNFQKLCEVELDKSNVPLSTLIPKDCETLKQLFNQFFEGRNSKIQVLKIENGNVYLNTPENIIDALQLLCKTNYALLQQCGWPKEEIPEQIKQAVQDTAKDLGADGKDIKINFLPDDKGCDISLQDKQVQVTWLNSSNNPSNGNEQKDSSGSGHQKQDSSIGNQKQDSSVSAATVEVNKKNFDLLTQQSKLLTSQKELLLNQCKLENGTISLQTLEHLTTAANYIRALEQFNKDASNALNTINIDTTETIVRMQEEFQTILPKLSINENKLKLNLMQLSVNDFYGDTDIYSAAQTQYALMASCLNELKKHNSNDNLNINFTDTDIVTQIQSEQHQLFLQRLVAVAESNSQQRPSSNTKSPAAKKSTANVDSKSKLAKVKESLVSKKPTLETKKSTLVPKKSTANVDSKSKLEKVKESLATKKPTLATKKPTLATKKPTLVPKKSTLETKKSTLTTKKSIAKVDNKSQENGVKKFAKVAKVNNVKNKQFKSNIKDVFKNHIGNKILTLKPQDTNLKHNGGDHIDFPDQQHEEFSSAVIGDHSKDYSN